MSISTLVELLLFLEPLYYFYLPLPTSPPININLGRLVLLPVSFFSLISPNNVLFKACLQAFRFRSSFYFLAWSFFLGLPVFLSQSSVSFILRYGFLESFTTYLYVSLFVFLPTLSFSPYQTLRFPRRFLIYSIFILFIGYVDFYFSSRGFTLLGRSLFDRVDVGSRFHSIVNEPRDYAVFSAFVLATYSLFNAFGFKLCKTRLLLLVLSAFFFLSFLLTKSATSVVGLVLFLLLLALFLFFRWLLFSNSFSQLFILISISILLFSVFSTGFPLYSLFLDILPFRLTQYIVILTDLLTLRGSSTSDSVLYLVSSSHLLTVQASTFLPLLDFLTFNLNDVPSLLLGHGHGSVTTLLTDIGILDDNTLSNSFSALTRLLYETGFVGFCLFLYFFYSIAVRPVLSLPLKPSSKVLFSVASLFLLSLYLAQRRVEIFIYMGLCRLYASRYLQFRGLTLS